MAGAGAGWYFGCVGRSGVEADTSSRVRRGFVNVDSRGRCYLPGDRELLHDRYAVEELPDGSLLLTPVVLVPVADWQRLNVKPRGPGGVPA